MNTINSPTIQLATFVADTFFEKLPEDVQSKLHLFYLDYLRVASVGKRMPWSQWAENFIQGSSQTGQSPVLFSNLKLDSQSAAFLNAIYSGSIDADDVHVGSMLHPGCVVFSAALAIGQSLNCSGSQIMSAVICGYEAMIRIGLGVQPSHFKRGFQSTSTCGVLGAAVAAAKLLHWQQSREIQIEKIAQTLGIASSFTGGLVQFFHSGSTVKRLHAAQASSSGVRAALLVEAGFSGPMDILEGKDGFAKAYADESDLAKAFAGLGQTFVVHEVSIKPHACSARVLSAIEAAKLITEEMTQDQLTTPLSCSDIVGITLGIPKVIQGRLTKNEPTDLQAAQMSAPFAVALSLHHAIRQFNPILSIIDFEDGLANEEVIRLAKMVQCELDEDVEKTSSSESVSAKLTLTLANGTVFTKFITAPQGSITRPYAIEDMQALLRTELLSRYEPTFTYEIVSTASCFGLVKNSRTFLLPN
ncbi:MmgE/PrpD family protein [Polynucleobacter rarus]|uniref:MmgE/PrpD family protein n=1 Tax=Polynucleobacter rarus TaxID=556055 RepID=UPI000D3E2DF8|nr:MmgE/PrpD family protein [Polynucleobacter rarus]